MISARNATDVRYCCVNLARVDVGTRRRVTPTVRGERLMQTGFTESSSPVKMPLAGKEVGVPAGNYHSLAAWSQPRGELGHWSPQSGARGCAHTASRDTDFPRGTRYRAG